MKSKALVFVTLLGLLTFSLATAGGASTYGSGAGPQDGSGAKIRRGQSGTTTGSMAGSRDRIRKGDGSCGEQGPQQTRKGNRGGKGQAGQ